MNKKNAGFREPALFFSSQDQFCEQLDEIIGRKLIGLNTRRERYRPNEVGIHELRAQLLRRVHPGFITVEKEDDVFETKEKLMLPRGQRAPHERYNVVNS
jgi:hypothetical protein